MRLALLPGLLLAVALAIFAQGHNTAQAAPISGSNGGAHTLFSVLAQTTLTGTATIGNDTAGTPTAVATVTSTAATTTLTGTSTTTDAATVTATTEVTGAGAITPTVTPATVPLSGQEGGGPNLQLNPFDWNFLTGAPPSGLPGPFAWFFLVLMLGLLGVSGYFYFARRPQWKRTNTPYYRAANRWAPIFMWIAVLGILFWFFRIPPVDFFNLRFWLYLILLIAIGVGVWLIYWYRTAFPKELARFQKTQRAKQYMPGSARPRTATGPSTPVPTPGQRSSSGKRRKKK